MKDLEKWTGVVTEILNMEDLKGQGLESSHKDDQPFVRKLSTNVEIKEAHDGVFPWVMSDETVDRDFDIIEAKGWDLSEFTGTLLFGHDYRSLPIGKVENARVDTKRKQLIGDVSFTDEATNPHGAMVQRLVEGGFLKTGSVGFLPMAWEDVSDANDKDSDDKADHRRKPRRKYTKQSLMEFSIVPVPSNPGAIQLAYSKGILGDEEEANKFLKEMFDKTLSDFAEAQEKIVKGVDDLKKALEDEEDSEEKTVITFNAAHSGGTPKADEGTSWSGPTEVTKAEVSDLLIMSAWREAKPRDDLVKGDFKLPHHQADGKAVVFRGVAAAMGALLGARGGVDVPENERRGIYNHLAKHYREFDKEPPEFKAYWDDQIEKTFEGIEEKAKVRLGAGGDDGHTDSITVDDETGSVAQNTNGGGGHKHGKGSLHMQDGVLLGTSEESNGHVHNSTAMASAPEAESKEIVSTIKHEFQPEFTEALKGLKNLGQDLGQLLIKEVKETIAQFKDLAEQIKKLVDDKSKAPAKSGNPGQDAQGKAKDDGQSVYDMIYESGKKIQSIAEKGKANKNE